MAASFRFEHYENLISKHHLKGCDWKQSAHFAFLDKLNRPEWTIARVQPIGEDQVEIIKRRDCNKSMLFKLGFDQHNIYQRVVINRKDETTSVDRFDMNWHKDQPFVGRRDLFYKEDDGRFAFVRTDVWSFKGFNPELKLASIYHAWTYKKAFKRTYAGDGK